MSEVKNYAHLFALSERALVDEIIRVDHAGELGAKYIYLGQLGVLKGDRRILDMYEGELEHLEYFESKIKENGFRPSILNPIWKPCAFLMGFMTAKFGKYKMAMLCTEVVESVIEKHYASQISSLADSNLKRKLVKFREEEMQHLEIGKEHGKDNILVSRIIKFCTTKAIKLSKTF